MFGNIFWMGSKEFCLDVNYYNTAAVPNKRPLPMMDYTSSQMKLDLQALINKVHTYIYNHWNTN